MNYDEDGLNQGDVYCKVEIKQNSIISNKFEVIR